MKRLLFVVLIFSLLLSLTFLQKVNILTVKAPISLTHDGDLIISDNDVYIIEGRFDINGSIIVEENATLILRNAIVNFTQVENLQFNITLHNPADGNPRLIVENASIVTSDYDMDIYFDANSTAQINELLTASGVDFLLFDEASVEMSNSTCEYAYLGAQQYSVIIASNSSVYQIAAWDYTSATVSNCTLNYIFAGDKTNFTLTENCIINNEVQINARNLNYSVNGLKPGFISYWKFPLNCSVTGTWVPDVTVENTHVSGWSFWTREHSNVTISNSELYVLMLNDFSRVYLNNARTKYLSTYDNSEIHGFDSLADVINSYANSKIWAINSTTSHAYPHGQSAIYVFWYLDVHVIDSEGTDVPSASVTAKYSNSTTAETKLTQENGWARLTLMQATVNASGPYPVGNYTITSEYDGHSEQKSVNMSENREITMQLDFIVPEFPSAIILPLLMIATLLAIMIRKKKTRNKSVSVS